MEGGAKWEPHRRLKKGTGTGVPKERQAAKGPPEACLRHRRREKWRSGAGDVWGHHATWREFRLSHPPQCPEGALESGETGCPWPLLTVTHREISKVIKSTK